MAVTREGLQRTLGFGDVHGSLEFLVYKGYVQATGTGYDTRYTITPAGAAAELEQSLLTSSFETRRGRLKSIFDLLAAPVSLLLAIIALLRTC